MVVVSSSSLPSSGPPARRTPPSHACLEARIPTCKLWLSCRKVGPVDSVTDTASLRVAGSVVDAVCGGCTKGRADPGTQASVLDVVSPTCAVVDSPAALGPFRLTGDPCAFLKGSSCWSLNASVGRYMGGDAVEDLSRSTGDRSLSVRPTHIQARCITDYGMTYHCLVCGIRLCGVSDSESKRVERARRNIRPLPQQ